MLCERGRFGVPFLEPFGIPFPAGEGLVGDPVRGALPEAPSGHFGMLLAALGRFVGRSWMLLDALCVILVFSWPLLGRSGDVPMTSKWRDSEQNSPTFRVCV